MRNSSRTWMARDIGTLAAALPPGSLVLDAGSAEQAYRGLFSHCQYESADFEKVDKYYAKSTYVCDLASIPVEDDRFDMILFSQVMEHLMRPRDVLKELRRVLKPGGTMFLSAPLFYEEHEQPYDFYRYTQFAWRHLLDEAGLELKSLEWMEGYLGCVAYQLETASRYLPTRSADLAPGMLGWISLPIILLCRLFFSIVAPLFAILDEKNKFTSKGFPINYIAIVTKSPSPKSTI